MQADVRTVEDVSLSSEAGEFTVAVGETADDQFEAAVVSVKRSGLSLAISEAFSLSPEADEQKAPIVAADEKHSAVGNAVDAYLNALREAESCSCGPDGACSECASNPSADEVVDAHLPDEEELKSGGDADGE